MVRALVLALIGSLCSVSLLGQGFTPPCELPFADIAKKRSVDANCDAEGQGSPESRAQNEMKNNFCAEGEPALITFHSLARLQAIVEGDDVLGERYKPPAERSILQDIYKTSEGDVIGEGDVVVMLAYVNDAHYSNVRKGETVNCKLTGWRSNDIHVELVRNFGETDDCKSATAEISPHYRPDIWSEHILNDIGHRPVRITGHPFFDASHKPCRDGKRPNPKRMSSWEIHPVYAIDVCKNKSLSGCKVSDESKWTTLEEWLNPAEEFVEEDENEQ